jgi:hypothetical protein
MNWLEVQPNEEPLPNVQKDPLLATHEGKRNPVREQFFFFFFGFSRQGFSV